MAFPRGCPVAGHLSDTPMCAGLTHLKLCVPIVCSRGRTSWDLRVACGRQKVSRWSPTRASNIHTRGEHFPFNERLLRPSRPCCGKRCFQFSSQRSSSAHGAGYYVTHSQSPRDLCGVFGQKMGRNVKNLVFHQFFAGSSLTVGGCMSGGGYRCSRHIQGLQLAPLVALRRHAKRERPHALLGDQSRDLDYDVVEMLRNRMKGNCGGGRGTTARYIQLNRHVPECGSTGERRELIEERVAELNHAGALWTRGRRSITKKYKECNE